MKICQFENKICPFEEEPIKREHLVKVIKGWKILTGIDPDDKQWDRVHYPRLAKSGKSLLILFGFPGALECMEYVFEYMKNHKLDCTLETVVKRSDLYREYQGGKNGILSCSGHDDRHM